MKLMKWIKRLLAEHAERVDRNAFQRGYDYAMNFLDKKPSKSEIEHWWSRSYGYNEPFDQGIRAALSKVSNPPY